MLNEAFISIKVDREERPDIDTIYMKVCQIMTGSGGSSIGKRIGAKFVQEVNAVSLSVEKQYPQVQSVVELGGQDAKIIIFKTDEETGEVEIVPFAEVLQ